MAAKTSWHRYVTKLRHCHPMYGFVSVLLDLAALRCGTYFRICRCRQDHVCNFARGNEWAMRKKRILEMTHIGVTVNTVYQNLHRSGPIQTYIKIGYGGKHWCRSTGNYQRIERKGTPQWTTTERHWQQNKTHTVRIICGAGYMWRSDVRLSYRSTAAVAWNGFVAGRSPDRRYRSTAAGARSSGAAARNRTNKCGQCRVYSRRKRLNTDRLIYCYYLLLY